MTSRRRALWAFAVAIASAAAPVRAQARPPRRVAFILTGTPDSHGYLAKALLDAMKDLGYIEGRDVVYAYGWAGGRTDRYDAIARDLARGKPEVIITGTATATRAAAAAAPAAAIVMAYGSDPVGNGLVASLARPGGRITGLSNLGEGIVPKMLELLCEVAPKARRVGVLVNPSNPSTATYLKDSDAVAAKLNVALSQHPVRTPEEAGSAVDAVARDRIDAMVVTPDPMFLAVRAPMVARANAARLPAIYFQREFVVDGGLMSYGTSIRDSFARSAAYVDRILKGADPGTLPVEQPTTFELALNAGTARLLGLPISPAFFARVSEVIP